MPPVCARCDQLCSEVYAIKRGWLVERVTWGQASHRLQAETMDPRIIWLCAPCTDEVAERWS